MMKLRKCPKCGRYTMEEKCPLCTTVTESAHPIRYSPEDKYGDLRLKMKEAVALVEKD